MSHRTLRVVVAALFAVAALLWAARLAQADGPPVWRFNAALCQMQVEDAAQLPKHVGSGDVSAALIGDSWATGDGVYPRELADRLGLDLRMAAVGGTGYVAPGACGGQEFISRVWEIPQDAQLVVLAGGLNDSGLDTGDVSYAVGETIAAVRSRAPEARVVVVGVPRVLLLEDEATDSVDSVLAESDADVFVDVRGWKISLLPDRIHPDPDGAQEYGRLLAEAIRSSWK